MVQISVQMKLRLRSYHNVMKRLRDERQWGSKRICIYLSAGGAEFHRQSIAQYLAKFHGQLPSAESVGLGEYQEEMVGVKIRQESKKRLRVVKQVMPMVVVPEVSEVEQTLETAPTLVEAPGIVRLTEIVKEDLDEEPKWGFREWETWRSSGVAENRDSGTYYIPRDKAKGPQDWRDGELGFTGFRDNDPGAWELEARWEGAFWRTKEIILWNRAEMVFMLELRRSMIKELKSHAAGWFSPIKREVMGGGVFSRDGGGAGVGLDRVRLGLMVYIFELELRYVPRGKGKGLDVD
jgi:hypothetical protein